MSEEYKGGVPLTGGLEVKGGGDAFPLVEAHDVYNKKTGKRLDKELEALQNGAGSGNGGESNLNLENGEGEGSLQQKVPTHEDVIKDFRHYAAAYGVATSQGLEGVQAIENIMNAYSYETLLGMIAQANFGGDTTQAQAYLDDMISSIVSDYPMGGNNANAPVSTVLGVGNTSWNPVTFIAGYNCIVGEKGNPLGSLGATALGVNLTCKGVGSVATGTKNIFCIDNFPDNEKPLARKFFDALKSAEIIDSYIDSTVFSFDGIHGGNNNFSNNGYIGKNSSSCNAAFGLAVIGQGSCNFGAGNQLVVSGHNNAAFGAVNTLHLTQDSFVAGRSNTIWTGRGFIFGDSNYLRGVNSAVFGLNNYMEYCWNSLFAGEGLRCIDGYNKAIFGIYNEDKADTLLEVGNGTSDGDRKNAFEVLKDGRAKAYAAAQDPEDLVRKKEFDEALENLPSGGNTVISGTWDIDINPSVSVRMNAAFTNDLQSYKMLTVKLDKSEGWQVIYTRDDGTEDIVYTKGEWYSVSSLIPTTKRRVVFDGEQVIPADTSNTFKRIASQLHYYKYVYQHNLIIDAGYDTSTVLGRAGDINIYYSLLSTSQDVTITNVWDKLPAYGDGILPASGYIQVYGTLEEDYDEYYIVTGICMRDNKLHVVTIGMDVTTRLVKFKEFNLDRSYMRIAKDTKITLNLGKYE